MLEKIFIGGKRYWGLIAVLLAMILIGVVAYAKQYIEGLTITGMSRDVSWGFYIAQFTFMVGVAASAVMVVLPYYLHNYKQFSRMVILGEFIAIPSVIVCVLFILVDVGQPARGLNLILFPSPNSPMFWDGVSLLGYLVLNFVIGFWTFDAERKGAPPPKWVKPLIYISIPWAVSIHTVTAFLYCGLEARHFWLTAILAPRFLASAFAAGPSILLMLCLIVRKTSGYDVGKEAIQKLGQIITYAMIVNVFFVILELFTGLYSNIPAHVHHFEYLYLGHDGHGVLAPFMMVSSILAVVSVLMLVFPKVRKNEKTLVVACIFVVVSLWIDKGLGMIVAGFVPSSLGYYNEYIPSIYELMVAGGIYGIWGLILTVLYKVVVSSRQELEQ
ncbi:MAG: polysulfide reductase NrfD [Deltaproteobacteria bacterium]|nr:polysulfide reductase NrfD [Deltaproteobacteria bacterium]